MGRLASRLREGLGDPEVNREVTRGELVVTLCPSPLNLLSLRREREREDEGLQARRHNYCRDKRNGAVRDGTRHPFHSQSA